MGGEVKRWKRGKRKSYPAHSRDSTDRLLPLCSSRLHAKTGPSGWLPKTPVVGAPKFVARGWNGGKTKTKYKKKWNGRCNHPTERGPVVRSIPARSIRVTWSSPPVRKYLAFVFVIDSRFLPFAISHFSPPSLLFRPFFSASVLHSLGVRDEPVERREVLPLRELLVQAPENLFPRRACDEKEVFG